jgi:hypothetical protein
MKWRQMTDDIAVMSFPWRNFGIDFRRNVTLLRLNDGRLVIHSTAPFTAQDIDAIRRFGVPAWLVEATLVHDTFAKEGRAALPDLPYLAPDGFTKVSGITTESLQPPPSDWSGEIDVLRIEGTRTNEHVLFHRRSRTLVVADSFFSVPAETRGWPRFFVKHVLRLPQLFGVGLFFRLLLSDRRAFQQSVNAMLEWNFERLIVAHWEPLEKEAKSAVERAVREGGFSTRR